MSIQQMVYAQVAVQKRDQTAKYFEGDPMYYILLDIKCN